MYCRLAPDVAAPHARDASRVESTRRDGKLRPTLASSSWAARRLFLVDVARRACAPGKTARARALALDDTRRARPPARTEGRFAEVQRAPFLLPSLTTTTTCHPKVRRRRVHTRNEKRVVCCLTNASSSVHPPRSLANGRKRAASTSQPAADATTAAPPAKAARNGVKATTPSRATTPQPTLARSASVTPGTPTRGGARGKRGQPPVYVIRKGINSLPEPVKALTLADVKNGLPVGGPVAGANPTTTDVLPRQLFVFGNGDMGQHGLGTDVIDEIKRPRKHVWVDEKNTSGALGVGGFEQIAAGGMHTLAVDGNGRLWSWGINDNAALGRQTGREPDTEAEVFETQPMRVEGLAPNGKGVLAGSKEAGGGTEGEVDIFRATRVAAGDSISAALSEDGQVRVWGSFRSNDGLLGFDGQVGSSKMQFQPVSLPALQQHSFSQIACGDDHILALTTTGLVYTWGNGQQLQLGRRIIERRKINGLNPEKVGLRDVVLIGTGAYHSFAVDKKGNVYGWGLNSLKQVGIDSEEDTVATPRLIPSLSPKELSSDGSVKVVAITAGQHHSLFLLSDGRVFGCGRCDGCELGLDSSSNAAMLEVEKMRKEWRAKRQEELKVEMAAWEKRMAAKKEAAGEAGQPAESALSSVVSSDDLPPVMGPPPDEYIATPVHVPFPAGAKISTISAGARFNLATDSEGKVYSWGFGNQSQLGLGDEESAEVPTEVKSKQFKGHRAVLVAAGGQHSTVLAVRDPEVAVE